MLTLRVFGMILAITLAGWTQGPESAMRFEAAAIRQSVANSKVQPCLCEPPDRIAYRSAPMLWILERAFGLQQSQMEAPAWVNDRAFDVDGVMPAGVAKEQIPMLLRALLEERFHLQTHRDRREVASLVLTVSNGGAKVSSPPDSWETGVRNDRTGSHLRQRMSMNDFAGYLSMQLGRPVLNETGLTGVFAIQLDFGPENLLSRADGGIELAPPLQTAVRDQLGLRLDLKKRVAEVLVIDQLDQVASQN